MTIEELLEEISKKGKSQGKESPLKTIWTAPRKTISYLKDFAPDLFMHRFMILMGVLFIVGLRFPDWMYVKPHPIGVMIQTLIIGPVAGIFAGYLYAALVRFTGAWFGGTCKDHTNMRMVVAWTNLPFVFGYIAFIIAYFFIYYSMVGTGFDGWVIPRGGIGYLPLACGAVFFIYGWVQRAKAIAEIQQISIGKAWGNMIASLILFWVPLITIVSFYILVAETSLRVLYSA